MGYLMVSYATSLIYHSGTMGYLMVSYATSLI
jgi:hypothetical protein